MFKVKSKARMEMMEMIHYSNIVWSKLSIKYFMYLTVTQDDTNILEVQKWFLHVYDVCVTVTWYTAELVVSPA
jgi:hypothetical protein